MIPATATRVAEHTAPPVNQRLRDELALRLDAYASADRKRLIDQRLRELDREWDVERTLQANFAVASLIGLGLAARAGRKWPILALAVPAFMVQHALQGWCPPLAVMRRIGKRTSREIADERFALQALRGDFDGQAVADPAALADTVQRH